MTVPVLRVAMNAAILAAPLSGIGRYVGELLAAMPQDIRPLVFDGSRWRDTPRMAGGAGRSRLIRMAAHAPGLRWLRRRLQGGAFAAGVRRLRPHLYHEPNFLAFPFDGPTIVTVHDLSWIRHPDAHPAARVRFLAAEMPKSLERADRIIVDTDFVAAELRSVFGVAAEKTRTVHLGVSPRFRPMDAAATAQTRDRYGLRHGGYVLTVGTREPRKNLDTLIAAHRALDRRLRAAYPLVIAGMTGWGRAGESPALEDAMRRGEVRLLGHVDDAELPALYAGAAVFAYPSVYEGFGLPPLESMASGVPVVVADSPALIEVGGGAVHPLSPRDVDAWRDALTRLLDDDPLREHMRKAGLRRAAAFTWEACTGRTVQIYRECIGTPPPHKGLHKDA